MTTPNEGYVPLTDAQLLALQHRHNTCSNEYANAIHRLGHEQGLQAPQVVVGVAPVVAYLTESVNQAHKDGTVRCGVDAIKYCIELLTRPQTPIREAEALPEPTHVVGSAVDDEIPLGMPGWLTLNKPMHPLTINLVVRFARALASKLADAEKKYGYSNGWSNPDWMDECRSKLLEHLQKGDPRDVANYCMFLWHHGESTVAKEQSQSPIDMILHCPACGKQHIDAPEQAFSDEGEGSFASIQEVWTNPPHRSHLCHGCGHIWRPADVPTNGVAAIKTRGKADSVLAAAQEQSHTTKSAEAAQVAAVGVLHIMGAVSNSDADVLISAAKWLERIHDRKQMLPGTFLDGSDPLPLANKLRQIVERKETPPTPPLPQQPVAPRLTQELLDAMNPRLWDLEMHNAWHRNIPNLKAAFAAIKEIAVKRAQAAKANES